MLEIMEVLSIAMDKDVHIYAIEGAWKLDDSLQSKIMTIFFLWQQKLKGT